MRICATFCGGWFACTSTLTDLGTLSGFGASSAYGVNDSGTIVGRDDPTTVSMSPTGTSHAFIETANGTISDKAKPHHTNRPAGARDSSVHDLSHGANSGVGRRCFAGGNRLSLRRYSEVVRSAWRA
jgi:uncharacterized membrane protein